MQSLYSVRITQIKPASWYVFKQLTPVLPGSNENHQPTKDLIFQWADNHDPIRLLLRLLRLLHILFRFNVITKRVNARRLVELHHITQSTFAAD